MALDFRNTPFLRPAFSSKNRLNTFYRKLNTAWLQKISMTAQKTMTKVWGFLGCHKGNTTRKLRRHKYLLVTNLAFERFTVQVFRLCYQLFCVCCYYFLEILLLRAKYRPKTAQISKKRPYTAFCRKYRPRYKLCIRKTLCNLQ